MEPYLYSRRILVAVTGLSPQVVTETLYALAVASRPAFVPTEVHLLTTEEGRERARLSLLHPRTGWFHRLRESYRLPEISFDESHIQVLPGMDGEPLKDIRTPEDNSAAADFITNKVRELTGDEHSALHVSIAGGRKTMGFYLGYALSLFGRAQDRLSHVLVSPPFESHPQFFFPTRESEIIYSAPPDNRPYDTRDAQVMLAEIPFVRLRDALDTGLIEGACSFQQAVRQAQQAVPEVRLVLEPARCVLRAGGMKMSLEPMRFALYWMLAERARNGRPGVHWSERKFEEELLSYYERLVGRGSGRYEDAVRAWRRGATKELVDPIKSHINRRIKQALGRRLAQPYLIRGMTPIEGTRYRRFGLSLPPEAVTLGEGKLAEADPNGQVGSA